MLLTDEEIVRTVEDCYGGKGYSPLISERAIAQAQLDKTYPLAVKEGKRQVVEWLNPKLDRIGQLVSDIRGDWSDPKGKLCEIQDILSEIEDGWQALCREVEE